MTTREETIDFLEIRAVQCTLPSDLRGQIPLETDSVAGSFKGQERPPDYRKKGKSAKFF